MGKGSRGRKKSISYVATDLGGKVPGGGYWERRRARRHALKGERPWPVLRDGECGTAKVFGQIDLFRSGCAVGGGGRNFAGKGGGVHWVPGPGEGEEQRKKAMIPPLSGKGDLNRRRDFCQAERRRLRSRKVRGEEM